jgi:hypothetical protein
MAHFSATDIKTSVIKLNFAASLQNVSNAEETTSPVNSRNQNKTPYMYKLSQTSVQLHRTWSKSKVRVHTGITLSLWHSNLNNHRMKHGKIFEKVTEDASTTNNIWENNTTIHQVSVSMSHRSTSWQKGIHLHTTRQSHSWTQTFQKKNYNIIQNNFKYTSVTLY